MNRVTAALASALSMLVLGVAHPAYSQEQPQRATAGVIEEIVVTARKRAEDLQDAPLAITAFSAAGIESRGLANISEIGSFTPNLTFRSTTAFAATSSASSIYIRGIGQQDWALGTDPGVGLYVDGVYVARSIGGVLDLLDVERIEVLKGPQGTLFGRNTIGGAISITTRKPQFDELYGSAQVVVGRYERADLRASVNLPVSENLAIGLALSRKARDGYVSNRVPGGPDLGDEGSRAARVGLRWRASDTLEALLTIDGSRDRTNPAANVLIDVNENAIFPLITNGLQPVPGLPVERYGQDPDPVCLDQSDPARLGNPTCFNAQWIAGPYETYSTHRSPNPFVDALIPGHPLSPDTGTDASGVSLDLTWDAGEAVSIRSITAYREVSGFWSRDSDHSPLSVLQTTNYYEQEQLSQELQFQGTALDDRLEWLLGAYYFEEEGTHIDVIELAGAVFDSGGLIDNDSSALFGQITYGVTDRLEITLGGRYTDETKRFNPKSAVAQNNGLGLPPGLLILPDRWESTTSTESTPHINVAWRWTTDVMAYATFSQGFKSGTFTQRVFPPRPDIPTARPEKADSYEAGLKSEWFDSRFRVNTAIFRTDYADMQVNVSEAAPGTTEIGTVTRNAAKARLRGAEIEFNAVLDALTIEGGIGYLDAEYTALEPGAVEAGLALSNRLVNSPEWSTSAAVAYAFSLPGGWQVTPRVDHSYTSTIALDATNTPLLIQEPVHLVNLGLRFTGPDDLWTINGMIRNLTDESVLVAGVNDLNAGIIEGVYSRPREWSLSVGRNF